ncbi:hypothetical protein TURU_152053 [Turdus rufiventris]|nr:hypothetical protein TURU_152053 [Turdus rufiventris]
MAKVFVYKGDLYGELTGYFEEICKQWLNGSMDIVHNEISLNIFIHEQCQWTESWEIGKWDEQNANYEEEKDRVTTGIMRENGYWLDKETAMKKPLGEQHSDVEVMSSIEKLWRKLVFLAS